MSAIVDPNHIAAFRLFTLIKGAKLEGMGLRRKGVSCLSILKREYGLKGSRAEIMIEAERLRQELLSK